jgi:hypothetical protein
VTAYFKLVRDEVGINHEDELIQALIALTDKIHPLAIGNVQRSHNQARMMARKLLRLHMSESQEHEIEKLIDTLKSNLFYHGHPINRREAKIDLQLAVVEASAEVESLMWELYLHYETDLKLLEPFNALRELELKTAASQPTPTVPPTTAQIVQQMQQLVASGISLGQVTEEQFVKLAAAMIPVVNGTAAVTSKTVLDPILGAYVESLDHADVFKTDLRLERTMVNTPAGPQEGIKHEVLWQRWEKEN